MRWSYNLERSQSTALWLFGVAALVVLMVIVGGATRLTGSGLSITEWKPIMGVLPPLGASGWAAAFSKYQHIPQYRYVNQGMTLGAFKTLFWWEWSHRLLGRLVGFAVLVPLAILLYLKRIPRRLIWRFGLILGLVALEGLVGWWMVASGLATRVLVAPERLATHLALALCIFMTCVWTGLEAWFGRTRPSFPVEPRWIGGSVALVVLVFGQMLLGALVAGGQAGKVYNSWPLMNGRVVPSDYAPHGAGLWIILAHNQASVQFDHRMGGYLVFAAAIGFALAVNTVQRMPQAVRVLGWGLAAAVTCQLLLGVLTLVLGAPLGLSLMHQVGAVAVLTVALCTAWRVQRN